MANLFYARIALVVFGLGLLLTAINNFFNGRSKFHIPKSPEHKAKWFTVTLFQGLLIYPAILFLAYWGIQSFGFFWGINMAIGFLIVKAFINHFTYRIF